MSNAYLVLLRNRRDLLVRIGFLNQFGSRSSVRNVPFCMQRPFAPQELPRFPATTASSDYCSRLRYWQFSQVPLQDFQSTRTRLRALRVAFGKVPSEPLVLRCMPPLPRRVPMAQIESAMRC